MKKTVNVKTLAITAAAVAVAGCAETTPNATAPSAPPEPARPRPTAPAPAAAKAATKAQGDENLARLQALDVVQVGALVVDYPAGSMNCYGPCPGQEAAIGAAEQKAAERLAAFVERAEKAAQGPSPGPCETARDKAKSSGKTVCLANAKGSVRQVLDIANFGKLFPIV